MSVTSLCVCTAHHQLGCPCEAVRYCPACLGCPYSVHDCPMCMGCPCYVCYCPSCPGCPYSVCCPYLPGLSLFCALLSHCPYSVRYCPTVLIPYVTVPTCPSCPYSVRYCPYFPELSLRRRLHGLFAGPVNQAATKPVKQHAEI